MGELSCRLGQDFLHLLFLSRVQGLGLVLWRFSPEVRAQATTLACYFA